MFLWRFNNGLLLLNSSGIHCVMPVNFNKCANQHSSLRVLIDPSGGETTVYYHHNPSARQFLGLWQIISNGLSLKRNAIDSFFLPMWSVRWFRCKHAVLPCYSSKQINTNCGLGWPHNGRSHVALSGLHQTCAWRFQYEAWMFICGTAEIPV